ncbi:PepSY domain-containing protein [Curvibacter sp. HBC61]|uniref:PepSY domain-containing protein n=1 Tax=Curvibacter cyanobacteriorum TaxID=3026422 RepID=A0ABT5MT26_9BURK|nr:PepSY domain-containing protein [Curvibacter sp. HBC61]MDD0837192.1 PepSY domain-containing protein [Curvibacter sp. HBC61]
MAAAAPSAPGGADSPAPTRQGDLYRVVWRWHFYAGLLALPWVLWLALTGGLYLFHQALDDRFHADLMRVPGTTAPHDGAASAGPADWVRAAQQAHPGTLLGVTGPTAPGQSARVELKTADGAKRWVYLDPRDARVLGALPERSTLGWTLRRLHSLKLVGPWARALIEITAGWTVLLVLTGLYLWWPRGRRQGVWSVRGRPGQRVFWRDLHALTGLGVGGVLLLLALTGLPWSVFLGAQINQWANSSHWGYPSGLRVNLPLSTERLADVTEASWSTSLAQLPQSAPAPGVERLLPPLTLDQLWPRVEVLGLAPGWHLSAPRGPSGVWTASVYPADLAQQRVVHLDAYDGRVLIDMRWSDYGAAARALEWGINVHLGQEFGAVNRWGLAAVCALTVLLCLAALPMWWWRRPRGQLGVPPRPRTPGATLGLAGLMLLGGVLMPLTGLSVLLMMGLDGLWLRRERAQASGA